MPVAVVSIKLLVFMDTDLRAVQSAVPVFLKILNEVSLVEVSSQDNDALVFDRDDALKLRGVMGVPACPVVVDTQIENGERSPPPK